MFMHLIMVYCNENAPVICETNTTYLLTYLLTYFVTANNLPQCICIMTVCQTRNEKLIRRSETRM